MIRNYNEKDIDSITEDQKSLNAFHLLIDKNYYAASKDFKEEFASFIRGKIKDKNFRIIVAEDKKRIIGYAMGWVELRPPIYLKRKIGYLSNIYVKDHFRNTGMGKRLYFSMEKWFKKKGVAFIELKTNINNSMAIKRFRSYGFTELSIAFYKNIKK